MATCFTEPELWPLEVLHCRNRDFQPFFLLWPWPWPKDIHIRTWLVFPEDILDAQLQMWTSYIKASKSYHLRDRQTRPKCLRGWSKDYIKYHTHQPLLVTPHKIMLPIPLWLYWRHLRRPLAGRWAEQSVVVVALSFGVWHGRLVPVTPCRMLIRQQTANKQMKGDSHAPLLNKITKI